MFFITVIIVLAALALILLLLFVVKIKAVAGADNMNISVTVSYLWLIRIRKEYVIKREDETFAALYLLTRKGIKPVLTLPDIIKKVRKTMPTDVAFVDIITVLFQSVRKKQEKSVFSYIYKKIKYDVRVSLKIGAGDAFFTAVSCGIINAAAGAACAIYSDKGRTFNVAAYPEFSDLYFSIKANCIIALSPADIIIGYAIYKKNKRR